MPAVSGDDRMPSAAVQEKDAFIRTSQELEEQPYGCLGACCRRVNLVLVTLTLLPLRIVLLLLVMLMFWILCWTSELCCGGSKSCCRCCQESAPALLPHTRIQRWLLRGSGILCRLSLFIFGFLWIPVRGECALGGAGQEGGVVPSVVANHTTFLDGVIVAYLLRGHMTGVAMRWVTRVPFIQPLAKAHHVLAVGRPGRQAWKVAPDSGRLDDPKLAEVERGGERKGFTDMIAEYQNLRAADPRLFPLLIFPEGTTKAERCLVQFRTGAFVSGQPVQPLVLRFPHCHVDHSWVGGLGLNFFRLATQWVNHAEAIWLPAYWPSEEETANPRQYADGVQRAMAVAMRLPPERYSNVIGAKDITEWLRSNAAQNKRSAQAAEHRCVAPAHAPGSKAQLAEEDLTLPIQVRAEQTGDRE